MLISRRSREERGSAAVEFALLMPIFFLLLFGIIDFGYMINRSSMINNASRDAVREASLGAPSAEIREIALSTLTDFPGVSVQVSCRTPEGALCGSFDADAAPGGMAIVQVNYEHHMLTPVGMFFDGGFNLSRKAEMRIE